MTAEGKLSGPGVNPNGDVVRHFDRSGKLIGSAVPRQTASPHSRLFHGYLAATSDRVGWYAPTRGQATYVEFSATLEKYKECRGIPNDEGQTTGFALTDSGKVFVTHYAHDKQSTYTRDPASGK